MVDWRKEILSAPDVGWCRIDPSITVLAGRSLSGKTVTGEALARASNLVRLDVDEYRAKIISTLGADPRLRFDMDTEIEIQKFAYQGIHRDALKLALNGEPVVVSASYSQPHYRKDLSIRFLLSGLPIKVFMLNCPDEEIPARLERRVSEGESASTVRDVDELLRQRARYQEMTEFPFVRINTNRPLSDVTEEILGYLKRRRPPSK